MQIIQSNQQQLPSDLNDHINFI